MTFQREAQLSTFGQLRREVVNGYLIIHSCAPRQQPLTFNLYLHPPELHYAEMGGFLVQFVRIN